MNPRLRKFLISAALAAVVIVLVRFTFGMWLFLWVAEEFDVFAQLLGMPLKAKAVLRAFGSMLVVVETIGGCYILLFGFLAQSKEVLDRKAVWIAFLLLLGVTLLPTTVRAVRGLDINGHPIDLIEYASVGEILRSSPDGNYIAWYVEESGGRIRLYNRPNDFLGKNFKVALPEVIGRWKQQVEQRVKSANETPRPNNHPTFPVAINSDVQVRTTPIPTLTRLGSVTPLPRRSDPRTEPLPDSNAPPPAMDRPFTKSIR